MKSCLFQVLALKKEFFGNIDIFLQKCFKVFGKGFKSKELPTVIQMKQLGGSKYFRQTGTAFDIFHSFFFFHVFLFFSTKYVSYGSDNFDRLPFLGSA